MSNSKINISSTTFTTSMVTISTMAIFSITL